MALTKLTAAALLATAGLPATLAGPASELPADFRQWAAEYEKEYASESDWGEAAKSYAANSELILHLNEDPKDGAEYGHNAFSDLSSSDFQALMGWDRMDPSVGRHGADEEIVAGEMPDDADWRTSGAITPVRDQASCGSCWAESAVENMESMWYLAHKDTLTAPTPLSVEQVIECDKHDYACYGGYPKGAYQYAIEHGGLALESDYKYDVDRHTICLANQTYNETCGDGICDDPPLTNSCDLTCSDSKHASVASFSGWKALPSNEDQIATWLAQNGPVSVALDASGGVFGILLPWLQLYKRGIANPHGCRSETTSKLDHAVLLVGYGEEKGTKYWTVRNSWGQKWGEQGGYFRIVRGVGKCGINLMATFAIAASSSTVVV